MPNQKRDIDLVAQARAGDLHAFDLLIARHRTRLWLIAREITRSPELAQDVVQEALLRAFRALDSLHDSASFGVWLNTIVRRESLRALRLGARLPESVESSMLQQIVTGLQFSDATDLSAVSEMIHTALAQLSVRERQITILHYLEGRSCEEIARQVGLAVGSIKRLLHNSRHKMRKECQNMTETLRKGPRHLAQWMSGEVPHGKWDAHGRINASVLARTICLIVNKEAKTVQQIADEALAHAEYVTPVIGELVELEVLVSPRKDRYLLNFIAFDAEDWRKIAGRFSQTAGEVAQRLTAAQPALRQAFSQTELSTAGWSWEDITWAINGYFIGNNAFRVAFTKDFSAPPVRPGGFPYWLGGYEYVPDGPTGDGPGFYGTTRQGWGVGHYGPGMEHKPFAEILDHPFVGREIMHALFAGPLPEDEALAQCEPDTTEEQRREALAKLISHGLVHRNDDGTFANCFPVFHDADFAALAPAIQAVIPPIAAEVIAPVWQDMDQLFDDLGYGHCRDQYPIWRVWLSGFILGAALQFMIKQGTLPELDDHPPAKWCFIGWEGDINVLQGE
jgi:RNA polymerase sigma-70 factor, ECF subfamily